MVGTISGNIRKRGKTVARSKVIVEGEATSEHFRALGSDLKRQAKAHEQLSKRPGQGFRRKKASKPET